MTHSNFEEKKRALRETLLAELRIDSTRKQQITRQPLRDYYPLSFAQRRLWFLNQLAPGNPFYNVAIAIPLDLWLNLDMLTRSLQDLVRRHEVLRTNFTMVNGEPVQVIAQEAELLFPQIDLRHLPPQAREEETQRLTNEEAQRPFDLEHDLLIRATLLRTGENNYLLLLTLHHIVCDGWSINLLSHELSKLYDAAVRYAPAALPELTIQYRDFAAWQQNWFLGESPKAQIAYWEQQLRDLTNLNLPTDHPRPMHASYRGSQIEVAIPKSYTQSIHNLCRQEDVTPFMALLTVFITLLHRYSGQDDIAVGSPISGRNFVEIENVVGFFVNTLVIRVDLSGDPTFIELLRRVRKVILDAFAHQDLPFEKLVEELQPHRDLSRNPLFQVMFQFFSPTTPNAPPSAAQIATQNINRGVSIFDLALHLSENVDGFYGIFDYASDLFDPPTVMRMARHFEQLLLSAIEHPSRRVSLLSIQPQDEQQQLINGWNDTAIEYPTDHSIPDLFEDQVLRTPDTIAVVYGDKQITYREINERANYLAHQLQALDAGPDNLIGLFMERSLDLVIAVLGILKSGAAYVPLDPAYPPARIELMAQGLDFVVSHKQAASSWPLQTPSLLHFNTSADHSGSNPQRQIAPNNLAYVIYTSGSTGVPKGIAMSHGALVNLITWQLRESSFKPAATVLQYASPSFDVSFQEIFSTWCSGGTLVMISDEIRRDPITLWKEIHDRHVERLFVPPVTLQRLAETKTGWQDADLHLCEVITAGEQLKITHSLVTLFETLETCSLSNHYGPAETHVCTAYDLTGPPLDWPTLPPIGHPIANTRTYLLDHHQLPVPIGVTGEVFVAGSGLARGYLNAPVLTADRFVPDPYSNQPGARMYRTGDLARYLSDGTIEFLGRADDQIKLRGYRIEPGEVETIVAAHPAVQDVVVTLQENIEYPQLIAYVVMKSDNHASGDAEIMRDLRRFTRGKLPAYMVPSRFLILTTLPTTASGKVDRRALPIPEMERQSVDHEYVPPRTPLEAGLEKIWTSLFHLNQISINADFFSDLGGHSLLATQLMSAVRETYQVEMPLTQIFEATTIAEFAVAIEEAIIADLETMDSDDT